MEANRAIFRAAVELSRLNETIDPVTIRSKAGAAASQEYMLDLMQTTQTAANAGVYAQEARKDSMRRSIRLLADSMETKAAGLDEPRSVIADAHREFEEIKSPGYSPGVGLLYGGSRGVLRVQGWSWAGRRTSGGKLAGSIRRHICQRWMIRRAQKARPGNPGQAVMILLDAPALGQDRERDKRPAALGVVNDAGHAVSVGGQLVAIRASENVLAPVSGLCRLKSCGQLYGNAPGSCPANLRVLLKRYLCGLACLDHIARAGDI